MKIISKEMKIIKENHLKQMKIIMTYAHHMTRNKNHKIKSYAQNEIMVKYQIHMKRNEKLKRKSCETEENHNRI